MAFTLNSIEVYGIEASEPLQKKFKQTMVLDISAAAADVAYDFGNYSGTFWTAVGGTTVGAKALKAIKDIAIAAKTFTQAGGKGLFGKANTGSVAPAAATSYSLQPDGTNTTLPNIAFFAANGPTSAIIVLEWELKAGVKPVEIYA